MFSFFIDKIADTFEGTPYLHGAIHRHDKEYFLRLLRDKNINLMEKDHMHFIPILRAIYEKLYDFAWELLERGVRPTIHVKDRFGGKDTISFLEFCVRYNHVPMIKMLILYGAPLEGINLNQSHPDIRREIKKEAEEATHFYQERIFPFTQVESLENDAKLYSAWKAVAEAETTPVLKECYQKKAQHYQRVESINILPPSFFSFSRPKGYIFLDSMAADQPKYKAQ